MDLISINRDLILGEIREGSLDWIDKIAEDDPGLKILSPLAKAAYCMRKTGIVPKEIAQTALSTIFIIAGEDAESLLQGESISTFSCVYVQHTIQRSISNTMLEISFKSEGSISTLLGDSDAWISLVDMSHSPVIGTELDFEEIINTLIQKLKPSAPACFPCDTDFIGVITYEITSIGGIKVQGFNAVDYHHAFELGHIHIDLEQAENDSFRWPDLLSDSQKADLGIDLITYSTEKWALINREQMLESYQEGDIVKFEIDRFLLCLGSGVFWEPHGEVIGEWPNSLDDTCSDIHFGEHQMPILIYAFPCLESETLKILMPVAKLIDSLYTACQ